jgi:hypothetical protein
MKPTPKQISDQLAILQYERAKVAVAKLNFPKQDAVLNDPNRFIAVQCSRRAGKTNALARKFKKAMDLHPKGQAIYLALTVESARDIMWPVLQEFNDREGWGWEFRETDLTCTHPNGSKLRILGADMKNFIKRLKGRKFIAVGIDEAQDFGPHLQSLIDDVLTPSLIDYTDSWLALTGTPGPVPVGYYFEVTQNKRYGYSYHEWTLLDNPYIHDAEGFIADLCKKREWDSNHPTLLREYRNKWILDVQSLWVRYSEAKNHFDVLPPNDTYHYIMGIDIGWKDADAIAVIAWGDKSPKCYLVEEIITTKQDLTGLVEQINDVRRRYKIDKIIMDEGALGKKMAEEMRRRHHIPVHPADKARKQETVEFMNDALSTGRLLANKDSRFARDSYLIQIDWDKSTPNKIVIKKQPHSDIIDSVLYGFKESPAYTYTKPAEPPKPGTLEWNRAEHDKMFQAELEGLQQEAEDNKRLWGND